jgi:hypothetical protein
MVACVTINNVLLLLFIKDQRRMIIEQPYVFFNILYRIYNKEALHEKKKTIIPAFSSGQLGLKTWTK